MWGYSPAEKHLHVLLGVQCKVSVVALMSLISYNKSFGLNDQITSNKWIDLNQTHTHKRRLIRLHYGQDDIAVSKTKLHLFAHHLLKFCPRQTSEGAHQIKKDE